MKYVYIALAVFAGVYLFPLLAGVLSLLALVATWLAVSHAHIAIAIAFFIVLMCLAPKR